MIKHNRGPCIRLYTMINSKKKNIFLNHLFYSVNKNARIPKIIPSKIKNKIKTISIEAGFYSQVVIIKLQTEVNDTE